MCSGWSLPAIGEILRLSNITAMQIIFGQVRLVRSPGPTPCSTHNRVHTGLSRFLQRKHSRLDKKLEVRDISKKINLFQPGWKLEDPFCTSVDKAHCSWVDRVEQTETGGKCGFKTMVRFAFYYFAFRWWKRLKFWCGKLLSRLISLPQSCLAWLSTKDNCLNNHTWNCFSMSRPLTRRTCVTLSTFTWRRLPLQRTLPLMVKIKK